VPQFLAMSFEMLRDGQAKMMENFTKPMVGVPGFDAMRAQQEAFLKAMTGGMAKWGSGPGPDDEEGEGQAHATTPAKSDDLSDIKKQLADLQAQLAKIGKK
jgi:polyhydroxyalkanoate synthesis regulator protein